MRDHAAFGRIAVYDRSGFRAVLLILWLRLRASGIEVDAHVGIFASGMLPVRAPFNPPIPAIKLLVWMGHLAFDNLALYQGAL